VKKNFFAAHKRVLIKIIPHHSESVYKFEFSHLHLSIAAICSAVILLAFLIDHIVVVGSAQAQVRSLQTVNSKERAQLSKFSNQTNVMMQRLQQLQKENQEIKRLTAQVQHHKVEPMRPRSAHVSSAPINRPAANDVSMTNVLRASMFPQPETIWAKVKSWISSRRDGGAAFASEATKLSVLDVQIDQTLVEESVLRAQAESAAAAVLAKDLAHQRYLDEIPSIWPTNGYVSSGFGYRSYPDAEFHPGVDIVNDYGAPIYATGAGIVTGAGWDYGYGNEVKIDHGNGLVTMYAHASRLLVSEGQYVRKGQEIALVGESGFATGPHVHYEVLRYGQAVDPTSYLNGIPAELANADPY
jgi:murein DD-endopeptidase MepM/ murein hydrolase activator NlpD